MRGALAGTRPRAYRKTPSADELEHVRRRPVGGVAKADEKAGRLPGWNVDGVLPAAERDRWASAGVVEHREADPVGACAMTRPFNNLRDELRASVPYTRRPQQRGVVPPARYLAGVAQVEFGRYAHAPELARDSSGGAPAIDLRAGSPAGNGVQIAGLESPEEAAARVDRVLSQDRALDAADPLGTAGPLRFHGHAQVCHELARLRGEGVSRATAGDEQPGEGEKFRAAHTRSCRAPSTIRYAVAHRCPAAVVGRRAVDHR
jgi:hypothetical protein